jgi:hypothetical protein
MTEEQPLAEQPTVKKLPGQCGREEQALAPDSVC